MPRFLRTTVGVAVVQSGLTAVLFSVVSPLEAAALAGAVPVAFAVLLWPLFGVYVLVAILIGQWPANLSRYLGVLVAATGLAFVLRHRKPVFPRDPILILVGVYTGVVLLSTIAPRTQVEIWSSVLPHLSYLALVWLFSTLVDSPRSVGTVVRLMVLSGVITSIVGLVQARLQFVWPASTTAHALTLDINRGKTVLDLQGWAGVFRVDSITGTPDYLALCLQTLIPFVVFGWLLQGGVGRRVLGWTALVLLGTAHVFSFTRGSLVITVILLGAMGWIVDRRKLLAFGPGLIVLGIVSLMAWEPLRERAMTMITLEPPAGVAPEEEAGLWRVYMIPAALRVAVNNAILGVGIGQQRYNWPSSVEHLIPLGIDGAIPPVHNSYLEVAIELGLGGLAVLLTLLLVAFHRLHWLVRRFETLGEVELVAHTRAVLVALVGVAMAMLVYPLLGSFRYFWLLLALTSSLLRVEASLGERALLARSAMVA